MSPVAPGKAKLGIQPYPVKDLKLDGYLPKVLYLPGDLSIDVSIIAGINGNGTSVPKVDDDNNLQVVDNSGKGTRWKKTNYLNYSVPLTGTNTFTFDLDTPDIISVLGVFNVVGASDPTALFSFSVNTLIRPSSIIHFFTSASFGINSGSMFVSATAETLWPIADVYRIIFVANKATTSMHVTGVILTEHLV